MRGKGIQCRLSRVTHNHRCSAKTGKVYKGRVGRLDGCILGEELRGLNVEGGRDELEGQNWIGI